MIKPKLKVDDRVRSIACSSKAIYPVRLAVLPTYKINELEGTLKGTLYADDLQKVTAMGLLGDEWDWEGRQTKSG